MNVLIFGYGLNGGGFYSAMYFLSRGDNVRLTDIRSRDSLGESVDFLESKGVVIHCGGHITEDFIWADLVLKSPTIRMESKLLACSRHIENDISYVSSSLEEHNVKIICVTGARYKTTTVSAICHALNSMGAKAHMCGNMGISPFTELQRWDKGDIPDYVVIEMSNWQTRDSYTFMKGNIPHVEVSVITSTFQQDQIDSDEDLNRTGEFNIHANHIVCPAEVKAAIEKVAARKAKNVSSIESSSRGISKALQDKMAPAFAVLKRLGYSNSQINQALKSFRGIPSRSELVLRTANAMFINDSSSVIPAAVNFTMDNFENLPVHLICGGSDSSLEASTMLKSLKKAASIHLLGGSFTDKRLLPLLKKHRIRYNGPYGQMEEAVSSASSKLDAHSNVIQVILLSPGASAYEDFANEFSRGEAFDQVVESQRENLLI